MKLQVQSNKVCFQPMTLANAIVNCEFRIDVQLLYLQLYAAGRAPPPAIFKFVSSFECEGLIILIAMLNAANEKLNSKAARGSSVNCHPIVKISYFKFNFHSQFTVKLKCC